MSLLEQVAALGDGIVSTDGVTRALGLADGDAFTGLVVSIADQDAPAALGLVAQLASRGADLRRFVADSLGYFRGIFLAQYAPNLEEITDEPPEVLAEWRRQARILSSGDVLRAIDRFSDALLQLRQGREERLVLELALIRLTRPETTMDGESLSARIDRLERDVKAGSPATSHQPPAAEKAPAPATPPTADTPSEPAPVAEPPPEPEPAEPPVPAPSSSGEVTLSEFSAAWPVVVARIRSDFGARRHAFVRVAEPLSVSGAVATLTLPAHQHFHLEQLNADDQLLHALEAITAEVLGSAVKLQFRSDDDTAPVVADEDEADEMVPIRAPEPDQLDEGTEREKPEDLIVDMLGGTVVEE